MKLDKDVAFSMLILLINLLTLVRAKKALLKAIREDAMIADNMRDYWTHQNCQAEEV